MNILEIIAMTTLITFGIFVIGTIAYCFGYTKGNKDMREIFRSFIENQWISVEDELPEECLDSEGIELDFFVWGEEYNRAITAHFDGKKFYCKCDDRSVYTMDNISCWQLPPNPPKNKK